MLYYWEWIACCHLSDWALCTCWPLLCRWNSLSSLYLFWRRKYLIPNFDHEKLWTSMMMMMSLIELGQTQNVVLFSLRGGGNQIWSISPCCCSEVTLGIAQEQWWMFWVCCKRLTLHWHNQHLSKWMHCTALQRVNWSSHLNDINIWLSVAPTEIEFKWRWGSQAMREIIKFGCLQKTEIEFRSNWRVAKNLLQIESQSHCKKHKRLHFQHARAQQP